jgi:hypothetical protein
VNGILLRADNSAGSATGAGAVSVSDIGALGGGAGAGNGGTLNANLPGTYGAGSAGVVAGNVTLAGKLAPGDDGVGTLTVNGLKLQSGAQMLFEFNDADHTNDFTAVTGTDELVLGRAAFSLYQENTLLPFARPGIYHLLGYQGSLGGSVDDLSVSNPAAGLVYTFADNTSLDTVYLSISPVPEPTGAALLSLTAVGLLSRRRRRGALRY